jgi:hypothetical protein
MAKMYIGPTIARIGLKSNTIVRGDEMLPQLKGIVDTNPIVAALFVAPIKVTPARQRMREQGSIEWLAARKVEEIAKQYKQ